MAALAVEEPVFEVLVEADVVLAAELLVVVVLAAVLLAMEVLCVVLGMVVDWVVEGGLVVLEEGELDKTA